MDETARPPLVAAMMLALFCGCASEVRKPPAAEVREPESLAAGAAQIERLCSRGRSDLVLDAFCHGPRQVSGLVDLRDALGFGSNENLTEQGFALTAHSTSLAMHAVSAINPRIVFIRPQAAGHELLSIAFARGDSFAEIAVRDRVNQSIQFYLVTFSHACDDEETGCSFGDLLTEAVESDWRDVNVYAEEDLENTPLDCRVCHQPDGPNSPKFLRMQEFAPPWNHWFWRQSVGGRAVMADYYAAKGEEALAGVPSDALRLSQPGLLDFALHTVDTQDQPNVFVSTDIEREVTESAAELGGSQPEDNSVPGRSATWDAIYERAKRGEAISVPYHDVKVTDAQKLARMTQAYTDYREGRLDRQDLPDIRDVFLDDPLRQAEIGLVTEPGLDGEGVLLQACAQCHNERLDQKLSRARFRVDLKTLDRSEKDRAIARIRLPSDSPLVMPPTRSRALSSEGRERLIELLEH